MCGWAVVAVTCTAVGTLAQFLGLFVAYAGLSKAWRSQPGEAAAMPWRAAMWSWARALLAETVARPGRRRDVTVTAPPATARATAGVASATVTKALDTSRPLDEQLKQLKDEVDDARTVADLALAVAQGDSAAVAALRHQHEHLPAAVLADVRAAAAADVPLAMGGLVITIVGTGLQLVGTVLALRC